MTCLIGVAVDIRSADLSGSVAPAFAVNAPSAAAATPTRKPSFLPPDPYFLPRILVLPNVKRCAGNLGSCRDGCITVLRLRGRDGGQSPYVDEHIHGPTLKP